MIAWEPMLLVALVLAGMFGLCVWLKVPLDY